LKIVLDTAEKAGKNVSSLKHALVSGAALSPSLRAEFDARGIAVLQAYATAELGVIAYETLAREGMIINESIIVEIVRPGSGDPVSDGEVGEVVVTSRAFSAVRATSQILGESPKRGSPRRSYRQGSTGRKFKIRLRHQQVGEMWRKHGCMLARCCPDAKKFVDQYGRRSPTPGNLRRLTLRRRRSTNTPIRPADMSISPIR